MEAAQRIQKREGRDGIPRRLCAGGGGGLLPVRRPPGGRAGAEAGLPEGEGVEVPLGAGGGGVPGGGRAIMTTHSELGTGHGSYLRRI